MSHLDSLAGLDSMVLHINTHSSPSPTVSNTAIALDGESFVLVPRKRMKLERARRTPLADKTPSFNTNGTSVLNSGPPRKPDISISIYQESANEPSRNSVASRRNSLARLPSFKPLPLMPESSPLRTSFLDLSFHSATPLPESLAEATPPTIPSSIIPQRSCTGLSQDQPKIGPSTLPKIHDEPFSIPSLQHPNSPYVPWAPPVRRRIIKPLMSESRVSVLSNCYSRPVSRSGARAPEPAETPEPVRRLHPASKGWTQFRQTISKGVNRVVTHFSNLKRPFAPNTPVSPSTNASLAKHTTSISHEDNFFASNHSPSSDSPLAVLTGRRVFTSSTASLASSDSTTLAAWLARRQRASLAERDYDPASMMSLEEYERMGSWLDLSGNGEVEGKWVCGVPGCEIHAQHMLMHGGQVTNLDIIAGKEGFTPRLYPYLSGRVLQRNAPSSQYGSSPQFRTHTRVSSGRRRPASTTPGDGSLSTSLSDQRERETSMPGGWTF